MLKLYYQRTKIQPVARDGRSGTKVIRPENENPAGRRRRPFQYSSCTTRFGILKLYYQRTKIQEAAGDGRSSVLPENENPAGSRRRRSSTKVVLPGRSSTQAVLPENENPAGRRGQPFQYSNCTTRKKRSSRLPATALPVSKLYYHRTKIQPAAGTAVPVLKLYCKRRKIQPATGDGRPSTQIVLPEKEHPAGRRRRSSTKAGLKRTTLPKPCKTKGKPQKEGNID